MKRTIFLLGIAILSSCQDTQTKATTSDNESADSATVSSTPVDLPYTATYSSKFTMDVSDADVKTVLMSYKDWADGNMANLGRAMGDSVTVIFSNGELLHGTNAELMKRWTGHRDSLYSVTIEMQAWQKMHEPDKKESALLTWYKEIDTYKSGRVDSAYYHDVNGLENGRIIYYSSYKRPAK